VNIAGGGSRERSSFSTTALRFTNCRSADATITGSFANEFELTSDHNRADRQPAPSGDPGRRRVRRVLFCHGTPATTTRSCWSTRALDKWTEALAGVPDDVRTIVCGAHAHALRAAGRPPAVVNAGSLGMPYGSVGAQWALLADGAVTLRRSAYDIEAARAAIRAACSYRRRRRVDGRIPLLAQLRRRRPRRVRPRGTAGRG